MISVLIGVLACAVVLCAAGAAWMPATSDALHVSLARRGRKLTVNLWERSRENGKNG